MNKEKLISLIIRKDTYKDTKTYLNQLAENKESAAKISAEAVRDILTTDYIAEAKLYAVRYLKDAFEKGNLAFTNLVETSILPILVGIAIDETQEKAVIKYAGSSYTKAEELAKFKSILSSLFRMAKECIIVWAQWIPDPSRKFVEAANQLKKKNVSFQFEFKYFRPENQQLFKEFSQKNGLKMSKTAKNIAPALQGKKPSVSQLKQPSIPQIKNPPASEIRKHKDPLAQKTEIALNKMSTATTAQDFQKIQNDFNQALNNYLENAIDFQQDLVQKWFDQAQNKKTEFLKKMKAKPPSQTQVQKSKNIEIVTPASGQTTSKPMPPVAQSKEKSVKEISKQPEKKLQVSKESKQSKVDFSQSSNKTSHISGDISHIIKQNIVLDLPVIPADFDSIQSEERNKRGLKNQQKQQLNRQQQVETKPAKSPQSASRIPKGPIVFDDVEDQPLAKQPASIQKSQKASQLQGSGARSLNQLNKGLKQIEQPRIPKQTETNKQQTSSKQAKAPLVPKTEVKPNLKIEDKPPQIVLIKPKEEKKSSLDERKNAKVNDMSVSKESDRVDFSEEDENSQFSEEAVQRLAVPNFKKKANLASIQEENDSRFSQNKSSVIPPIMRSPREEQGLGKRGNAAANKLLQQNTILFEKLQKISKQLQHQRHQKVLIQKQKVALQKQLSARIQNQQKLVKKVRGSVPIEDYNRLKRQLEQQREEKVTVHEQIARFKREFEQEKGKKSQLAQENALRRSQQERLQQQLLQTQEKLKNLSHKLSLNQEERLKVQPLSSHLQPKIQSRLISQVPSQKTITTPTIKKQPVDEDYIKNLTHPSNMHSWLNEVNIALFKKNVLGASQIFYRDDYLTLLSKSNVYTQNNQQFLSIQMSFQFKAIKQVQPQVKYKNCQELDLWTKPLAGEHPLFTQELVVKLHRNPLKILKGQVRIVEGLVITFLLPFMYFNFLREEEFSSEQFQEIFNVKSQQIIKSKIVQLNSSIFKEPNDLQRVFKNSTLNQNKIRFCLSEGISDQVFLGQFQLLRNNKVILRILSIPYTEEMSNKAKELLQNIIFLVS